MKYIELVNFRKLHKEAFKRNPLYDYEKNENRISFIVGILLSIMLYLVYITNEASVATLVFQNLLLYIGAALLGMLGFLVGGLAIISGTISNKVAVEINKTGKIEKLLYIMFSFYYAGAVIGTLIILYFSAYILVSINYPFSKLMFVSVSFLLSYGLSFAIFYSVSLLGTCLNMFIINYNFSHGESKSNSEENIELHFNSLRIDTLTRILVSKDLTSQNGFIDELEQCIDKYCSTELKSKMYQKMREYYSLPDKEDGANDSSNH